MKHIDIDIRTEIEVDLEIGFSVREIAEKFNLNPYIIGQVKKMLKCNDIDIWRD